MAIAAPEITCKLVKVAAGSPGQNAILVMRAAQLILCSHTGLHVSAAESAAVAAGSYD